jgi:hypothetical protein
MKKQMEEKSKLSLNKFQIAKIKNPQRIIGGNFRDDDDTGNSHKRQK